MSTNFFLNIVFLATCLVSSLAQVAPTWITSSYVQAASYKIINGDACGCKTNNASTPTASITFATSFPAIPNLGFGISNYQGTFASLLRRRLLGLRDVRDQQDQHHLGRVRHKNADHRVHSLVGGRDQVRGH
jgi:hypothetical protein